MTARGPSFKSLYVHISFIVVGEFLRRERRLSALLLGMKYCNCHSAELVTDAFSIGIRHQFLVPTFKRSKK